MNQETRNYEEQRKILDSGARREFASGAVRDIQEGKGRCDLLPLEIIGEYLITVHGENEEKYKLVGQILCRIDNFVNGFGNTERIYGAIVMFCDAIQWSSIDAILEVSKHYEEGAKKYEERNWEKGIPCHCYVDSGVRHLLKWAGGWTDEPHDRAFLWNMFCLLWTIYNKPDLNDLPFTKNVNAKVTGWIAPKEGEE